MLLLFLMGLTDQDPGRNYQLTPIDPAIAMPYDAGRTGPWLPDYTTALPDGAFSQAGASPAASDYSSSILVAQAGPSNAELEKENLELRKRIDELETLLKGLVTQPPVEGPQPKVPTEGTKSVPGWVVEVHQWNKGGRLGDDPLYTLMTKNCPFDGSFANEDESHNYIYRFQSTFRVKEAGRYVLAFDTTCDFGHQCTLQAWVDGGKVIEFEGNTTDSRLQQGLPLSVGDHSIEFRTWLHTNTFLHYDPADKFRFFPLVKGPQDLNAREFRQDELFATIPATVKGVVQGCNY